MRIIFVRHGEPDYINDCLTEEGRRQALACAERLAGEDISEIYTSPCGRASETAAFTAERLGLPVTTLDFMREIHWGGLNIPHAGHPWTLGDILMEDGFDFHTQDWYEHPFFKGNAATECYRKVIEAFDGFLSAHGYRHKGRRLFCEHAEAKTIALFSHGGSGACVLAHLLDLPFPYVCSMMPYDFTSIIIVDLPPVEGTYIHPRLEFFNDCAHIRKAWRSPILQRESEGVR